MAMGGGAHRGEALLLGGLAVRKKGCTPEQVEECLWMQSMSRSDAPLEDLLLFKGYVTAGRLKDLLARQHRKPMSCPACRRSFTVRTFRRSASARCPRCKGELSETAIDRITRLENFASSRRPRTSSPAAGPPVRAACILCDHPFEGVRDPSGRVHCPSCRSSFSPR